MPPSTRLQPLPGFDWSKVKWGGPDEPLRETCSYCEAPIDEEAVPLILWKEDGSGAVFCDDCGQKWWGFGPQC